MVSDDAENLAKRQKSQDFCRKETERMNSKQNKSRRFNLLLPVIIIFCLMVVMVAYTTRVIWNVAVANIYEVGEDRITNVAARLENYLDMTKSTLWVTADTVDHMAHNGASPEDILRYITEE